jgi:hypothetical protein
MIPMLPPSWVSTTEYDTLRLPVLTVVEAPLAAPVRELLVRAAASDAYVVEALPLDFA